MSAMPRWRPNSASHRNDAMCQQRSCRVVPLIELLAGSIFLQTCATKGKDVRMTETLQTAGLPRQGVRKQTAAVALTALGVVYGDIGTSTLYGLKQAVEAAGAP